MSEERVHDEEEALAQILAIQKMGMDHALFKRLADGWRASWKAPNRRSEICWLNHQEHALRSLRCGSGFIQLPGVLEIFLSVVSDRSIRKCHRYREIVAKLGPFWELSADDDGYEDDDGVQPRYQGKLMPKRASIFRQLNAVERAFAKLPPKYQGRFFRSMM